MTYRGPVHHPRRDVRSELDRRAGRSLACGQNSGRVRMIKEAVSPLEPRYEDLAGDGMGRKARRLFLATRPKFLTASVLPVLVGTAWGATVAGAFDFGVALLALLATALVHCASNVINDVAH